MLRNFSFGDYFKKEAITYAWDFLVNELKLDESRLWFSVFEGDAEVGPDDEARIVGIGECEPERVLGFGRKDNFWQMGDTGPCGPCSEIHYYMGDDPSDPGKRQSEMGQRRGQHDDGDPGIWSSCSTTALRKPTVGSNSRRFLLRQSERGMGLERITAVMQNVFQNKLRHRPDPPDRRICRRIGSKIDRNDELSSSKAKRSRVWYQVRASCD